LRIGARKARNDYFETEHRNEEGSKDGELRRSGGKVVISPLKYTETLEQEN